MCVDCNCGQPVPPVVEPLRQVAMGQRLLVHNDAQAAANRAHFAASGVRVINLLSSPGSGKTALLERLARELAPSDPGARHPMAVIVGDLATDNDARRLRAAGVPALQITTGQACHLEAAMVHRALHDLAHLGHPLDGLALLVVENVGNLVCPAAFDLGESQRVVLLSVTEGEDKPLKYPAIFHSADVVVISKSDLAEACGFDGPQARGHLARVAPQARIVEVSSRTGDGIAELLGALGLERVPVAG